MNDGDAQWREKSRYVAFMRKDEAIFSEALREGFPHVIFLPDRHIGRNAPSSLDYYESLAEVPTETAAIAFPDSGLWRPPAISVQRGNIWDRYERILKHHFLLYVRITWDWDVEGRAPQAEQLAYDLPTMDRGRLYGWYDINDRDHEHFLAIAERVFRVVSRIATNRTKGGHPLGNLLMGGDTVMKADASRSQEWCGHSLLEWCREGQKYGKGRMLFGTRRPCDDWEVPKNKWYQSLIRKVTERYGIDFGDPPPPNQ